MVEISEITLEKLRTFTGQSNTLITIDAPLFSSFMIFNGQILAKSASYVEPEKIGNSIGFRLMSMSLLKQRASGLWTTGASGGGRPA